MSVRYSQEDRAHEDEITAVIVAVTGWRIEPYDATLAPLDTYAVMDERIVAHMEYRYLYEPYVDYHVVRLSEHKRKALRSVHGQDRTALALFVVMWSCHTVGWIDVKRLDSMTPKVRDGGRSGPELCYHIPKTDFVLIRESVS